MLAKVSANSISIWGYTSPFALFWGLQHCLLWKCTRLWIGEAIGASVNISNSEAALALPLGHWPQHACPCIAPCRIGHLVAIGFLCLWLTCLPGVHHWQVRFWCQHSVGLGGFSRLGLSLVSKTSLAEEMTRLTDLKPFPGEGSLQSLFDTFPRMHFTLSSCNQIYSS